MFFKENPQTSKYLLATTFSTLRYDPFVEKEIAGLCTDNLQSCVCLIFVGISGRISLTHTNFEIDMSFLQAELQWVQEVKNIYFLRNCNPARETVKDLYPKYMAGFTSDFLRMLKVNSVCARKLELLSNEHGIAAVDNKGKFVRLPIGFGCEASPYKHLRESINLLNHCFTDTKLGCDIQYQNGRWSACSALQSQAKKIADHCDKLINRMPDGAKNNDREKLAVIISFLKNLINDKNSLFRKRFDFQGKNTNDPEVQLYITSETGVWATKILNYLILKDFIKENTKPEGYAIRSVFTPEQLTARTQKIVEIEHKFNDPAAALIGMKQVQSSQEALKYLQRAEDSLKSYGLEDDLYAACIYSNFASCYQHLYSTSRDSSLLTTAKKYCEQAVAIRQKYYSKGSEEYLTISKKLEECDVLKTPESALP